MAEAQAFGDLGAGDMSISLRQQIACVKREIADRRNWCVRRVAAGTMKQVDADREIATMEAVLDTLCRLEVVRISNVSVTQT
jgi:hypothetical protein